MKATFLSCAALALALLPAQALAAVSTNACQSDLSLAPTGGGPVGAVASLCAPQLQTQINLQIDARPAPRPDDPLTSPTDGLISAEAVGLTTAWDAPSGIHVDLSAADKLSQSTTSASLASQARRQINSDARSANLALTMSPTASVDLTVSGAANQRLLADVTAADDAGKSQTLFSSTSQDVGVGLKWSLPDGLSLNAGNRLQIVGVDWRGASSGAGSAYGGLAPSLNVAATTPAQGRFGVTVEEAVSPIDSGALAGFASVADRSADARFGPNREWRYRLDLDQPLSDGMKLTAALIHARLESTAELGPADGGLQAPISIAGGQRSEIDVSLTAPLAALGLPTFSLKGVGAWKASQIRDPFTGQFRPLSGETPVLATIELTQSLPLKRTRWGLQGHFGGDQSLYQMSQTTNVSVADSLGGFVEYTPGPFALRLQIDGLCGGLRDYTDTYFSGARADGLIDHVDHRSDSSQAVRLILRKSL